MWWSKGLLKVGWSVLEFVVATSLELVVVVGGTVELLLGSIVEREGQSVLRKEFRVVSGSWLEERELAVNCSRRERRRCKRGRETCRHRFCRR